MTIEPRPRVNHLTAELATAIEDGVEIHRHLRAPDFLRRVDRGTVDANAGVVDEDVQSAVLLVDRRSHVCDLAWIGDIELEKPGPLPEFLRSGGAEIWIDVRDDYGGPSVNERLGDRETNSAPASCH